MNQMDNEEALDLLRRAGFSPAEVERLGRLRRAHAGNELDQPPAEYRRFAFIRWLVTTGRLTDHIV